MIFLLQVCSSVVVVVDELSYGRENLENRAIHVIVHHLAVVKTAKFFWEFLNLLHIWISRIYVNLKEAAAARAGNGPLLQICSKKWLKTKEEFFLDMPKIKLV